MVQTQSSYHSSKTFITKNKKVSHITQKKRNNYQTKLDIKTQTATEFVKIKMVLNYKSTLLHVLVTLPTNHQFNNTYYGGKKLDQTYNFTQVVQSNQITSTKKFNRMIQKSMYSQLDGVLVMIQTQQTYSVKLLNSTSLVM